MNPSYEYAYHSLSVHNKMCIKMCESVGETPYCFKDDGKIQSFFEHYDSFTNELSIIDLLIPILIEKVPNRINYSKESLIVKDAAQYIEQHIKDELSIQEVAKELNVSSGYLSRIFKKLMHITPKQYLIQCRIRVAKRELEKASNDIDIAYDLGFASQSHMCTVFKKYMGISVGDYKNIIH